MTVLLSEQSSQLGRELNALTGVNVMACDQCEECTSDCPAAHAMKMKPHELMRAIQLDKEEEIYWSGAIWTCVSCNACSTCCPQGINILRVIDELRELSKYIEYYNPYPTIPALHRIFMAFVKRYGRVHILGLVLLNNIRMMTPFKDIDLASPMLLKRKFNLLPDKTRGIKELRQVMRRVREIENSLPTEKGGDLDSFDGVEQTKRIEESI